MTSEQLRTQLQFTRDNALLEAVQICQTWIDNHNQYYPADEQCTYNDCDMVAAVTDVRTAILKLQHPNKGPA